MRYIINVIAILVVAIIVTLAIYCRNNAATYPFHGKVQKFLKEVSRLITTQKHNIKIEFSPSRKRKVSCITQEESLRQYAPSVFGNFNDSDWNKFWGFIYDPIPDSADKYRQKRYHTKEEIEGYLIENYSIPFSSFKEAQWYSFWGIIDLDSE